MTYIVYCITTPQPNLAVSCKGVERQPVSLIVDGPLGALVSLLPRQGLIPSTSDLLAYENVIEALHRIQAVVPMRFGCVFDEEGQIRQMLHDRQEEFRALLNELDEMVEMSLRVRPRDQVTKAQPLCQPYSPTNGTNYLAGRREHYEAVDGADRNLQATAEQIRNSLSELTVKSRGEPGVSAGGKVHSLFFLIHRASVSDFRLKVLHIRRTLPAEIQLSGPWPPHNFVEKRCQVFQIQNRVR